MSTTTFYLIVAAALGAVVAFQIWITRKVWRSSLYERSEKVNQTRLVWLLPLFGAVIVLTFLENEERPPRDGSGQHRS